ncbi:MAG: Sugar transporter, permease protein [Cyanobacteria bacterium RYN_339]|nr:Sugar transporter, permease protein [Cyanobacteria bacterium RYN_339]
MTLESSHLPIARDAAPPKPVISRQTSEILWAYAFIALPVIGFLVFAAGPMLASFYLSFTRYEVLSPPTFIGLDNYVKLFSTDLFVGKSMWNTVFYMLGIPVGMGLSLMLALALNQKMRFQGFFRTVYFLPSVCSLVALALLWKWIYNAEYGLINTYLAMFGVANPPSWLDSPILVKPALIVMGVWGGLGYNMVLFLAALQGVPRTLYEAAEIDGANAWQRFWNVTWPMISPTTFFVAVMGVIGGFQNFDQIFIMTRGGPEYESATYMIQLYQMGFQYFKMGYASAMAWVLAAIIMGITWFQFKASQRWVHND